MIDADCIEFLQWALPRMRMRWPGFRRVRRQVCKRLSRRLEELGLDDVAAYRDRLEHDPGEWRRLDALCRITISRFWRDAGVFDRLSREVLPVLAERAAVREDRTVHGWSAGCASGEEPYSLAIAWNHRVRPRFPAVSLRIVATDSDPAMIARAREGRYPASSLKALPREWIATDFTREESCYRIHAVHRDAIEFRVEDVRTGSPDRRLDLVLCRNLAFTYFTEPLQRRILERVLARLRPGGALVIGSHEHLPQDAGGLTAWPGAPGVFSRDPGPPSRIGVQSPRRAQALHSPAQGRSRSLSREIRLPQDEQSPKVPSRMRSSASRIS